MKLSANQRDLLELLSRKQKAFTTGAIALEFSPFTLEGDLRSLERQGLARKLDGRRWSITDEGRAALAARTPVEAAA